jgi:PAS domain S-box-containing protein
MFGYDRKESIGRTSIDLGFWPSPEDRARITSALIKNKTFKDMLIEFRTRSGKLRLGQISLELITIKEEVCIVTVIDDITERKRIEEALHESEAQHKSILQTAMDGFMQVDTKGRLIEVNETYCQMSGYSEQELLSMSVEDLEAIETEEKVAAHIQKAMEYGNDRFVTQHLRKNGTLFDVEVCVQYRSVDGGRIVCFLHDISDRKNLQARIQQAQKAEAIGTLAGGIAHDFNNLLSPIIGMTELLLDDLAPGSLQHENVKEILTAGIRSRDLVKQILAFSRQTEHEMIPVRVQQILKEVLKLSRSTIPSNIEIFHDIQSDCGLVMADPTQLHQVAMNLITNAYHDVEPTSGKITVQLRETEIGSDELAASNLERARYVVLTVSDTGCGIEPAIMDKIFNPYFTTKDQGEGTGLGLAVVNGIVNDHHGDIKADSEVGKGTNFKVYLPVMEKPSEIVSAEKMDAIAIGDERILLVDDEEMFIRFVCQMLERLGYRVTTRSSSVEALEAFRANPDVFELVLTDMTMPNMTGDQLAKEIISIKPDIPIIICTGFSERIDKEKAKNIGIKGFLMKPIVKSEMAQIVRNVLDDAKGLTQG